MKGYWNKPEATANSIQNGWFYTGDAGYLDEDGYLYIHDRIKDMIVSGGENIYPAEVENALFAHPAVGDVAVIGVPDDKWGEAITAVVSSAGGELDSAGLIVFVKQRLAGYKAPKHVVTVDEVYRSPSGKADFRRTRQAALEALGLAG